MNRHGLVTRISSLQQCSVRERLLSRCFVDPALVHVAQFHVYSHRLALQTIASQFLQPSVS